MYYTIPVSLRCYEVLMQGIPGFGPPGQPLRYYAKLTKCEYCLYCKSGKCRLDRCPYIEEKVMAGTATLRQIMDEVMIHIRHPPFLRRLEHYIKECEDKPMTYADSQHERAFTAAIEGVCTDNTRLLAVLYLLSAGIQLWRRSRFCVEYDGIRFDHINLGSVGERAYLLFVCAKDLYLGTKHITIADLCDAKTVSPKMFGLICNAMALRRFGVDAMAWETEGSDGEKEAVWTD